MGELEREKQLIVHNLGPRGGGGGVVVAWCGQIEIWFLTPVVAV